MSKAKSGASVLPMPPAVAADQDRVAVDQAQADLRAPLGELGLEVVGDDDRAAGVAQGQAGDRRLARALQAEGVARGVAGQAERIVHAPARVERAVEAEGEALARGGGAAQPGELGLRGGAGLRVQVREDGAALGEGGLGGDLPERAAAADRPGEGLGGQRGPLGGGDEVLRGGRVVAGAGVELTCPKEQVLTDMSRRTGERGQLGGAAQRQADRHHLLGAAPGGGEGGVVEAGGERALGVAGGGEGGSGVAALRPSTKNSRGRSWASPTSSSEPGSSSSSSAARG